MFMNLENKKNKKIDDKNYKTIVKNYKFTKEDASNLKSIEALAILCVKELLKGFYAFIFEFEHAKKFLHNKEILSRHEKGIELWYSNLFCGKYDEEYFEKLNIIS